MVMAEICAQGCASPIGILKLDSRQVRLRADHHRSTKDWIAAKSMRCIMPSAVNAMTSSGSGGGRCFEIVT